MTAAKSAVVIGKTTIRSDEEIALRTIGRALALRGITLYTTNTPGVGSAVAAGYMLEGGTPMFLKRGDNPTATETLVFTNTAYQRKLDQRDPDWRSNGWLVFHNSKATRDAAEMVTLVLDELGTPLVDGGNSSGDGQPAEPEVAHSSGPAG